MNFKKTSTEQWYLVRSTTPQLKILFVFLTMIRSIRDTDFSVKCMASSISCLKLKCCSKSFILLLLSENTLYLKKVREKSRECHNHKPQPFPDPKRKRKPTNPNKHKSNKRTKSTKISFLFPKRGNRNTKRTEKRKNKMTHGKTYNKSPRRINYKATKSKTNTGTTALERSVE